MKNRAVVGRVVLPGQHRASGSATLTAAVDQSLSKDECTVSPPSSTMTNEVIHYHLTDQYELTSYATDSPSLYTGILPSDRQKPKPRTGLSGEQHCFPNILYEPHIGLIFILLSRLRGF